jgi:hypothetical protein
MICALCKTEIESDPQIRNEHSYHECCAMTFDKDEQFIVERDSESQWFVFGKWLWILTPSQIINPNLIFYNETISSIQS